jgi:glycosyltransferase involved in cell wall biosynthesis
VIVDTGSTNGTQRRIHELLHEIPGSLYERPWRGFAENRNEAIQLARDDAEYSLVMDADEELVAEPGFRLPRLEADAYLVPNEVVPRESTVSGEQPHEDGGVIGQN